MNPLLLLFGFLGAGASFGMRSKETGDTPQGLGRHQEPDIAPPESDFSEGENLEDTGKGDDAPTGLSVGDEPVQSEDTTTETSAPTAPTGKDDTDTDTGATTGSSGSGTTETGSTDSDGATTTGTTTGSTTTGTTGSGSTTTGTTGSTTTGTTTGSTTTGSTGSGSTTTGTTGGTTTGTTTGSMDHGSGHTMGSSTPSIQPPGIGASQSAVDTYLSQLAAQAETHIHSSGSTVANEHMAAMNLVPRGDATHVAIGDGDWFDPNTWSGGQVPGDGAKVLIPDGVSVNYAGTSNASIFTLRIDGVLDFDTQTDSQMIFDTMVVSPSGHLVIGTTNDPVNPNVDIDLIVANNGPIDTNWDPMLLSRGIIAHGGTSIHGAVKDSHEKVSDDPMAGDTSIKFAGVPQGWEVGDTIVVAGTRYDGYTYDQAANGVIFHPPEDEVRVITGIDADGTIHLDQALVHDHDAPRADLKTSVANYTRNVSIETENGDSAAVYERGHVMFMHSDNVDVRYAEFLELGRTDKSTDALAVDRFGQTSFDSNVQGRYAFHLHRTGTSDPNDPAIAIGNAVNGSPGWGFVHHDSNAILDNNASYDTHGAGFVAETGNEIGSWNDNIAIFAQGNSWESPKDSNNIGEFDIARSGDGFWFQGRMVASTDNVAASVNHGFTYFHRDGSNTMIDFDASAFAFPEALFYNPTTQADDTPILSFDGNEVFAANQGLHIVKHGPNQGHDVWSHLNDFTAWSVISGAHLEYTSHYVLSDFDLISRDQDPFIAYSTGIQLGTNASDITIVNSNVDGFKNGIDLNKTFVDPSGNTNTWPADLHNFIIVDGTVTGANTAYQNFDGRYDQILSGNQVPNSAPDLQLDSQLVLNDAPTNTTVVFSLTGTKTDSLGQTTFPGGTEGIGITGSENTHVHYETAMRLLATKGYWTTSSGQNYTLLDVYFTDRLTGEVFVETHPIYVNANVSGITNNGMQDITSSGGVDYAGSTALDVATLAVPSVPQTGTTSQTMSSMVDMSTQTVTQGAMVPDTWLTDNSSGDDMMMQTASFASFAPITTEPQPNADEVPYEQESDALSEAWTMDDAVFDAMAGLESAPEGPESAEEAETGIEAPETSEEAGEALWDLLTEDSGTISETDTARLSEEEEEETEDGVLFAA